MDCLLSKACNRYNTDKCTESCFIKKEFYFLMESANIPQAYYESKLLYPSDEDYKTFETLADIKDDIVNFVKGGRFLLIYGDAGNSKTSWVINMMKSYFAQKCIGNRFTPLGYFAYIPTFTLKSKDFENRDEQQQLLEDVATRKLVVLDDIAVSENSSYDNSIMNHIVNERYSRGLATLFTSNIPPDRLRRYMDDRISDRICSDIALEITGNSRREYTTTYERRNT